MHSLHRWSRRLAGTSSPNQPTTTCSSTCFLCIALLRKVHFVCVHFKGSYSYSELTELFFFQFFPKHSIKQAKQTLFLPSPTQRWRHIWEKVNSQLVLVLFPPVVTIPRKIRLHFRILNWGHPLVMVSMRVEENNCSCYQYTQLQHLCQSLCVLGFQLAYMEIINTVILL